MSEYSDWYKMNEGDKVWWRDKLDSVGEFLFSFDKKTQYNLFADYRKLTAAQKKIFDAENPEWAEYFNG